jgi:hypothetical protein
MMPAPGILHSAVRMRTDFGGTYQFHPQGRKSAEQVARENAYALVSCSADFRSWRWRLYVPPKRRFTYGLHCALSHKMPAFIVMLRWSSQGECNWQRMCYCCAHSIWTEEAIWGNARIRVWQVICIYLVQERALYGTFGFHRGLEFLDYRLLKMGSPHIVVTRRFSSNIHRPSSRILTSPWSRM